MPSPTSSPRKPSPEFTQYYGILVKLPRGPNVTAPFAPPFRMREASDRIIPRESKDASAVPSVLSSWDVDSRISFLLVEKTTWDDRDLTLRSKLAAGTYWNMSAQGRGNLRREMDRTEVAQISGIEVIGLGDGEYDALKKCRQCKCSITQAVQFCRQWLNSLAYRFPRLVSGLEVHADALGRRRLRRHPSIPGDGTIHSHKISPDLSSTLHAQSRSGRGPKTRRANH